MKKLQITLHGGINDSYLEEMIQKKDKELKEVVRKNAVHYASKNQPEPLGDALTPYVGEFKAGYEKLGADVIQHLQPSIHFPEAKVDADYLKEKNAQLEDEITQLQMHNTNDAYELEGFNPTELRNRMTWAIVALAVITLGEILFNSKALQLMGDSFLSALLMSVSISVGIYLFVHGCAFLYKKAKTKLQRRSIIIGGLAVVLMVFTALAMFRSRYLEAHNIQVHPAYFVAINVFFFIVSALIAYFMLPTWAELKQNAKKLGIYNMIRQRSKKIEQLIKEKGEIPTTVLERTKGRIRITHHTRNVLERLNKMYLESVEMFKSTNLIHRTDRKVPDCFTHSTAPFEVNDEIVQLLNTLKK